MIGRLRNSCDQCSDCKLRCDGEKPTCRRCSHRNRPCFYSHARPAGRPPRHKIQSPNRNQSNIVTSTGNDIEIVPIREMTPTSSGPTVLSVSPLPAFRSDISDQHWFEMSESIHGDPLPSSDSILDYTDFTFVDTGVMDDDQFCPPDTDMMEKLQKQISLSHWTTNQGQDISFSAGVITPPFISEGLESAGERPLATPERYARTLKTRTSPTATRHEPTFASQDIQLRQLDKSFEELLNESEVHALVVGMTSSSAHYGGSTCGPDSCRQPCDVAHADYMETGWRCRCTILLSRLQLIISHPIASGLGGPVPLDLALFVEQAMQEAHEAIARCTMCRESSSSTPNLVILCLVADWLVNSLQGTLKRELDANIMTKMSSASTPSPDMHRSASRQKHTDSMLSSPSLDTDSVLRVGFWVVCQEAWAICIRALLKNRVMKIDGMLRRIISESWGLSNKATINFIARTAGDMAQITHGKVEALLGMIELWAPGRRQDGLFNQVNRRGLTPNYCDGQHP
ncbi:hypothetical protein F5X99DRAFT_382394 [Biscogniauxia marginata]|nr:hypothetical protein F5X99DRAFT_382394 [Biscogniauxia marginata]